MRSKRTGAELNSIYCDLIEVDFAIGLGPALQDLEWFSRSGMTEESGIGEEFEKTR